MASWTGYDAAKKTTLGKKLALGEAVEGRHVKMNQRPTPRANGKASIMQVDHERETECEKAIEGMRNWLLGRCSASRFEGGIPTPWSTALSAFDFARKTHVGRRKNGDPEMIHQVRIAHYLRTIEIHLVDAPLAIAAAMLHDIREDYGVGRAEIAQRFGALVDEKVELLTKKFNGVEKAASAYYAALGNDWIAIVKGADRAHNHSTMGEAFAVPKQLSYMVETEEYVLPMLEKALANFHWQEPAFENVILSLHSQISLARPVLELAQRLQAKVAAMESAPQA